MYYVYIIGCEGDYLYTGIAADVEKRLSEHFTQSEKCAKFTRSHKAQSVEAVWTVPDKSAALKLEWRIKQLTKMKKLELIGNPESAAELLEVPTEVKSVIRDINFKNLTTI